MRLPETCVGEDNANSENEFGSCLCPPLIENKSVVE